MTLLLIPFPEMLPQFRGTSQAPSIVTSFFPRPEEWRYLNEKLPQIANAHSEDNECDKNSRKDVTARMQVVLIICLFGERLFAIFT